VAAIFLSGCDQNPNYRYKMMVDVATEGGVRHYSTVREVEVTNVLQVSAPNAPAVSRKLTGEAVVMGLPGGNTVFALLDRALAEWPEDYALPRERSIRDPIQAVQAMASVEGAHALPRRIDLGNGKSTELWPTMVRFATPDDPRSVVKVDPDALPGGASVKRITIEITDEPVSNDIRKWIGWLDRYRDLSFAGNRYSKDNSLPDSLRAGSFTTEFAE